MNHSPMKIFLACLFCLLSSASVWSQDEPKQPAESPRPLNKSETVLIDKPNNRLLLKTTVCLREGLLEMLLCTKQTKEHESILTIDAPASLIHAGLLGLGAVPGKPVQFRPEFKPPQGQVIDIFVNWTDKEGKEHRVAAQKWVRYATYRYFEAPLANLPSGVPVDVGDDSLRYDSMNKLLLWFGTMSESKRDEFLSHSDNEEYQQAIKSIFDSSQARQMKAKFIFAGSGFTKLDDGELYYQAEAGSVICVANFSDAMIDVNIESTASDAVGRSFEPYSDRIPEVGTEVTVELIPVPAETKE